MGGHLLHALLYSHSTVCIRWTKKSFLRVYYRSELQEPIDPSSNTRVLSGVEVRSQSWWSCRNRSAAAILLRFRLRKNDLTTIYSSYFTRLSQIWPPPIWLSCRHHHRTTLDIPLEQKRTLFLLLKNLPPSLVFLPRSIILWNSLPSELQKSSSLSTFKSALRSHLCT